MQIIETLCPGDRCFFFFFRFNSLATTLRESSDLIDEGEKAHLHLRADGKECISEDTYVVDRVASEKKRCRSRIFLPARSAYAPRRDSKVESICSRSCSSINQTKFIAHCSLFVRAWRARITRLSSIIPVILARASCNSNRIYTVKRSASCFIYVARYEVINRERG